jgi:hypothetical protein
MDNVRTCTGWGLAISGILLSPIVVIFSIPLAIGIGLDIFDLVGEVPFALALCAPAAFVLLRLASSGPRARLFAAAPSRPRQPMIARPG